MSSNKKTIGMFALSLSQQPFHKVCLGRRKKISFRLFQKDITMMSMNIVRKDIFLILLIQFC